VQFDNYFEVIENKDILIEKNAVIQDIVKFMYKL